MSRKVEDTVKKRQLLKSKLEGKLTEDTAVTEQQRKNPPTRLHIPTIFQGKSVENLTAIEKIPKQNISLSRSTGNLFKTAAWHVRNSQQVDVDKTTVRPVRKLSTSFCLKVDDSTKEKRSSYSDTLRRLSNSFNVKLISDEDKKCNQENENILKGFNRNEEREIYPVVVSSIKKQNTEQKNNELQNVTNGNNSSKNTIDSKTIDVGAVVLRRKLRSTRPKSEISPDISSTMCFNFTDKVTSPTSPRNLKSPLAFDKIEKKSELKRSGSRVGFIAQKDVRENGNEYNNYDKSIGLSKSLQNVNYLYENVNLNLSKDKSINTKRIDRDEKNNNINNTKEKLTASDNVHLKKIPLSIFPKNSIANATNGQKSNEDEEIINETEQYFSENEVIYANIEIFRQNNYFSNKFIMGPIYKRPIPSRRSIFRK